jgi:hypothetical protein
VDLACAMKKLLDFIYGSAWGLLRRFRFWFSRRGLCYFSNCRNRRTIKMTGIGNCESRVRFYPSDYHFIHDMPCLFPRRDYDYLIAQNFLHEEFLKCRKSKVFFTLEPPPTMTPESRKNLQSEALKPFLYLYDESDINKRMFYPCLPNDRVGLIGHLEDTVEEERGRLCCIINRYSEHPELDLVRQRILFVQAMGSDIDIYGAEPWGLPNKWKAFPNYYGAAGDKEETLRKYNFVLAFENSNFRGYITEKIIDAFKCGTVPLYRGGGELLRETFPSNCFIDCSNQDPARIYAMIRHMPQQEIIAYRRAGIEFLKSDMADRFTSGYLKREIIRRLEGAN